MRSQTAAGPPVRQSQTVARLRTRYHFPEGTPIQPVFTQENANELIREYQKLGQQVSQLEKRLDKYSSVLRAVFELMRAELHLEPAALAEKLAEVVREKAEQAQAPCVKCNRPLGNKKKCMYCGEERKTESIFDLL
jgi:flagellar biosynthesis/type III secretory pathway protein FliH